VSDWGWSRDRANGGSVRATWLRGFAAIVPFLTVGLLLQMLNVVGGTMTTAEGVLFDLPEAAVGDEAVTDAVALLIPVRHETHVFFDDSRYVIGSAASMRSLDERLSERFSRSGNRTLLVLADRRVSCGDLMEFASRVRKNGVQRVFFAKKSVQEAVD